MRSTKSIIITFWFLLNSLDFKINFIKLSLLIYLGHVGLQKFNITIPPFITL